MWDGTRDGGIMKDVICSELTATEPRAMSASDLPRMQWAVPITHERPQQERAKQQQLNIERASKWSPLCYRLCYALCLHETNALVGEWDWVSCHLAATTI